MVRQRMNRRLPYLTAMLCCCTAHDCDAIERVILEVGQLSTAGVQAKSATITLDVSAQPTVRAQAGELHLAQPDTVYSDVDISCIDLLIKELLFACYPGR